jgi:hypothetical protein
MNIISKDVTFKIIFESEQVKLVDDIRLKIDNLLDKKLKQLFENKVIESYGKLIWSDENIVVQIQASQKNFDSKDFPRKIVFSAGWFRFDVIQPVDAPIQYPLRCVNK